MEVKPMYDAAIDDFTLEHKLSLRRSHEIIDELIHEIEQALIKIQTHQPGSISSILQNLKEKSNGVSSHLRTENRRKNLNTALQKYSKLLEKSFNREISKPYSNVEMDSHTVNLIILGHFYRRGLFELGDFFATEAGEIDGSEATRSTFFKIHMILGSLRNHEFEPAFRWIDEYKDRLAENVSTDLELKLHRIQLVLILQERDSEDEATQYAKKYLTKFSSEHDAEIQSLMKSIKWAGRLKKSPYSYLISSTRPEKFADELMREYCKVIGIPTRCPLKTTIAVGIQSLPILLKIMKIVMKENEWEKMEELPFPIELDREFQFHTIFVCPISRMASPRDSHDLPVLLSCGHVINTLSSIGLPFISEPVLSMKCPCCNSFSFFFKFLCF